MRLSLLHFATHTGQLYPGDSPRHFVSTCDLPQQLTGFGSGQCHWHWRSRPVSGQYKKPILSDEPFVLAEREGFEPSLGLAPH